MPILNEYLKYLNEAPFNLGGEIVSGTKLGLKWGLVVIPAMIAGWKVANAIANDSVRKCGALKPSSPGFTVCVARERIKSLKQKEIILNRVMANCSKAKDPELCRQNIKVRINQIQNRIQNNNTKINDTLSGTQENVQQEIAAIVPAIGSLAIAIAAQSAVDKAIFLINRTAQSSFRESVRKCGVYKDNTERKLCMTKYKIQLLQQKIDNLNRLTGKCNQTKNPQECLDKLQKLIGKAQRDFQIEKDNITAYTNEIELEKREAELKERMRGERIAG